MSQGKTIIIVLFTLVIGFAGGFILRPVISPIQPADTVAAASPAPAATADARGTQYFVAHIDEARQVVAGCRDGSVRSGEREATPTPSRGVQRPSMRSGRRSPGPISAAWERPKSAGADLRAGVNTPSGALRGVPA